MRLNETLPADVAADMVDLINALGTLPKDARVNYKGVKFDYVTLDAMLGAVKKNSNKFAVDFLLERTTDGVTSITPLLRHRSGEVVEGGTMSYRDTELAGTGKPGPQTTGMVITYCKRYSLAALLGIASDEDTDATLQEPEHLQERALAEATQSVRMMDAEQRDVLSALKEQLPGANIKAVAIAACGRLPWDGKGAMSYDDASKLILALSAELSRKHQAELDAQAQAEQAS